jgi:ABC-type lipoprotein release transport system permease subunit
MALPLYYNWRNLLARRLSTALTFSVVTVIVGVLAILLSFAEGIRESMRASGSASNVIVLTTGATAESTSIIKPDEANRVNQAPGIAVNEAGALLVSPEICVQSTLRRKNSESGVANVAVRGVDPVAFDVHPEVRMIEGRRFAEGALELVVGNAAKERYAGLEVGNQIDLGRTANRTYKVVGVFEAAGSALESEIWALRSNISDSYHRRFVSSVVVRLVDKDATPAAIDYIQGPAVRLKAKTETAYYEDLSNKTREIVVLTSILIGIMAIGAIFAVANTMYAAVDGRKREIAMLRTLGFARRSIIISFLIESTVICLAACASGLVAGFIAGGLMGRQDFLSDTTWTVLAYDLHITFSTIAAALVTAMGVGIIGGLAPALRASRMRVIEALRKA